METLPIFLSLLVELETISGILFPRYWFFEFLLTNKEVILIVVCVSFLSPQSVAFVKLWD